ncbi:hypothetical protein KBY82_14315 [Cyanobium sp. AMD-g]|uniref:WD40 repeat domain-containing protein n=1 Tax=Cyanobium sp. AMD-g TaxID=2823699 RepID=UPI0020CEDBF5|nr:hypothetical protein [Cyanobium sp. AMD-g]MCP9931953.1 hypothetical protein [Cyanobium sp. AMD-g]
MAAPPTLVQERLCGACGHAITAQTWSADGELLAMASAGGELLLIDFRAGCEELLRGERDSSLNVAGFSADDRFLMAAGQDGELLLWELGGSGVRPIAFNPLPLGGHWLDAAAWQPQGSLLAVGAGKQLRLWDGASRSLRPESQELKGTVLALAWSRDGRRLAAACHGEVLLWSPDDPAQAPQRCPTGSAGLSLGWSGQGNLLASGQLDGSLMLWPDGGAGRGWQFRGFPGKARALTWCDQPGRLAPLLAVASADIAVLWSQQDRGAKGWKPEPLVLHEGRVHAVAFAPGSSLLATASGDGTVGLWDGRGRLQQLLEGDGQAITSLSWRPDGCHLVAGGAQGQWWLWPVTLPPSVRSRPPSPGGFAP